MSVVSRNPDGTLNVPGSPTGRPMPIQVGPDVQRQAVIDQLAPSTAGAQPRGTSPTPGSAPTTGGASLFARGGQVRQLPGMDTKGLGETVGGIGAGVAGQMAARGAGEAAKRGVSAGSFGSGAAGAATSAGIGLATGMLADKLRVKEEMPTFGGAHGDITDAYGRRFEGTGGGVASNAVRYAGYGSAAGPIGMAIGAGLGSIIGGATKNAPSAYTDFRVEDAADAISKAYEKRLGRPASDEEIRTQLVNQGWDPNGGDRWVGEKGLFSVLDSIAASPEAQDFTRTGKPATARAAVVDQLGAGAGTASTALAGRSGRESAPAGAPPVAAPGTPGAAPADLGDTSGWNTDGYATPQYVAPVGGSAPPGWDQKKWNDPNHQTPKYVVGRILAQHDAGTPQGVARALPDLERAYPGTTFNGKDKITIPGVGTIDVVKAAGLGGQGIQWDTGGGGGAAAPAAAARGKAPAAGDDLGARGDLLADLQAAIDRITRGEPDRAAMLDQLAGAGA